MRKVKVLVIDDSKVMQQILTELLNSDPKIEVVGTAPDPIIARDLIKQLNPDVLTLDVEMPKMDGITFLKNLMRLRPMPVIMVSSLTAKGADATLEALELGAIDFLPKPNNIMTNPESIRDILVEKVHASAKIKNFSHVINHAKSTNKLELASKVKYTTHIIGIGSSTGGLEAIRELVGPLPNTLPPIVIAQHIPPIFSKSFAKRLNNFTDLTVHEAEDKQPLELGHLYIAPGNHHLTIKKENGRNRPYCELTNTEPVNKHRPSVEVLFNSIAQSYSGRCAIGVMLTGMGRDGAQGLKNLHNKGAYTIAQDEKTSVVWGMPGAAVEINAVDSILPINKIGQKIIKHLEDND